MRFSVRNHVRADERADEVSRLRRAVFAYVGTFGSLGCAISFVYLGYTGPLVERVADSLIEFSMTMALLYLGAGVLDRSRLLNRIGDGFRRRPYDPYEKPSPGE